MHHIHGDVFIGHRVIALEKNSKGACVDVDDEKTHYANLNSVFGLSAELLMHLCDKNIGYMRQYINTTQNPVTIVERNGMRSSIAPLPSPKPCVILRQWYFIPMNRVSEFSAYLNTTVISKEAGNTELEEVRRYFQKYITESERQIPMYANYKSILNRTGLNRPDTNATKPQKSAPAPIKKEDHVFLYDKHLLIFIDVIIEERDLQEHPSIYIHSRDVVVSTATLIDAPAHPYDGYAAAQDRLHAFYEHKGLTYHLDLVSNKEYLSRYIMLAGDVQHLASVKDESRQDGVYVILQHGVHPAVTQYYSLEEAQTRLGLYPSEELARSAGNVELQREQALESLRHENKLMQIELERERARIEHSIMQLKHEHAQERANLQERLNRLEEERARIQHERDMFKHEIEFERLRYEERLHRLKEEYEQSSFWRKNATELIKLWPIILTIAAGIAAIHAQKAKAS